MARKMLCAVDDTDHSKAAVVLAAEMAKAMGADLTLLAVNELIGSVGRSGSASYVWDDAEHMRVLAKATDEAKASGISAPNTIALKSRDVARAIIVCAEEVGADHIVVGTGGKGGITRLVLGSVSRDVVFRSHCPVTVAR